MKNSILIVGIICFLTSVTAQWNQVVHLDPYNPTYEPNVILVKFKDDVQFNQSFQKGLSATTGIASIDQLNQTCQMETMDRIFPTAEPRAVKPFFKDVTGKTHEVPNLDKIYKLKYNATFNPEDLARMYAEDPNVEYAEPDYHFFALATYPDDPLYVSGDQWYIDSVRAPAAWDSTTGDTTQIIGIIDTGVDWDHPDLDSKIWINKTELNGAAGVDDDGNGYVDDIRGWDFVNNDNNPNDDNSHGTHVAGIAAAETDNGVGVAGIAWGAKIMAVKMLQSSGQGSSSDLASAINYAAQNGATVINMSLGTYGESQTVKTALENAYATSVLVAAAGNDGYKVDPPYPPWPPYFPMFPACYSFVIGVEASTQSGGKASFSNFDPSGPTVANNNYGHNYEIKAPGVNIWSTFPNSNYNNLNGTSMASPIVAGAVALMKSYDPIQSTEELFAKLIQGSNNGVLDIYNSMDYELVPDLHYVRYTLIDTLPGCDGDGIADAGEMIELYLTVKNAGGFADSVWSKIRFSEFEDTTTADILDSTSYIGDISAYATLTGSSNPFRIEIGSDVVNNRDIAFEYEIGSLNHITSAGELVVKVQNGLELAGIYPGLIILKPDVEYIVTESLVFDSLIIKPGVELQFGEDKSLLVNSFFVCSGKPDSMIQFTRQENASYNWGSITSNISNPVTMDYCIIEYGKTAGYTNDLLNGKIILRNSIVRSNVGPLIRSNYNSLFYYNSFLFNHNNIGFSAPVGNFSIVNDFKYNIVYSNTSVASNHPALRVDSNNLYKVVGNTFLFNQYYDLLVSGPFSIIEISPNYFGTTDTVYIGERTVDYFEDPSLPALLLSNILSQPSDSAHGQVWKVEINDHNPQEFQLDPIGSETVQFDVYFNRAMNTTYTPFLTFGVREPYTQHFVIDSASWSADSTIWTAYYTVGLETGDGINIIRVANARDDEGFEIPIEDSRFQFTIQAAGAAAIEFIATAGIGKVDLEWPPAESPDVLGYNMYRIMKLTDSTFSDTTMINNELITDSAYTDYNVIPDSTYRYAYKVLGTDMVESDYSKWIAATPVNAPAGDANGDLAIDVLDITTIVSYLLNQNPQPFIFDAADVNDDGQVNVLDIVAIVNIIMGGESLPEIAGGGEAAGLALESQGVRLTHANTMAALQLKIAGRNLNEARLLPGELLKRMEYSWHIQGDTLYAVIYNLGNHPFSKDAGALLRIDKGQLKQVVEVMASNPKGEMLDIEVGKGETLVPEEYVLYQNYPNPFNPSTTIRYGLPERQDVEITIYNILGQRIRRFNFKNQAAGYHELLWDGRNSHNVTVATGVYIYQMKSADFVNNKKMLLIR